MRFLLAAVAATLIYIISIVVIHDSQKTSLTDAQYLDLALTKYYGESIDLKKFKSMVRRVKNSTNELIQYAILLTEKESWINWKDTRLTHLEDTNLDVELLGQLWHTNAHHTFTNNINAFQLKANVYRLYCLNNLTNLNYVTNTTNFYRNMKNLAIYFHDINANEESYKILNQFLGIEGLKDPSIQGWLGSLQTKKALTVSGSMEKIKIVNEGVHTIDNAVYANPNNLSLRMIRIMNYLSIPPFFKKYDMAYNDIMLLLDHFQKDVAFDEALDYNRIEKFKVTPALLNNIIQKLDTVKSFPGDRKETIHKKWEELKEKL
jgi:hypothetical protein